MLRVKFGGISLAVALACLVAGIFQPSRLQAQAFNYLPSAASPAAPTPDSPSPLPQPTAAPLPPQPELQPQPSTLPPQPELQPQPSTLQQFFKSQVGDGATLATDRVWAVWNYPITIVEDRPITPGTIVSCFVLMWIGYIAAKFISWWFGARFLPRLKVHPSAIIPLQTIFHYVLLATFMTLALKLSNVPLNAFTFLGGAIAIGVGFGSQTIMNNFISGLILLAERPVRVGDLIEIEGEMGRITKIGPRSTHLLTPTNVVIVLPNSKLLEGTVVNWTLSDDSIRTKITCGVAYGSRTRDVERWLLEAARKQEEIQQDPPPFVIFAEFGDNALTFELHFWISLKEGANRIEVESDLRFTVDDLFRSAGIVMAYPQRDVHLNVLRPIEVRVVGQSEDRLPRRAAA